MKEVSMHRKYYIELGFISFLLGISILLQKLFWTSIAAAIVYYIVLFILLNVVNYIFDSKKIDRNKSFKISYTCWFIGFLVGYSINYINYS